MAMRVYLKPHITTNSIEVTQKIEEFDPQNKTYMKAMYSKKNYVSAMEELTTTNISESLFCVCLYCVELIRRFQWSVGSP